MHGNTTTPSIMDAPAKSQEKGALHKLDQEYSQLRSLESVLLSLLRQLKDEKEYYDGFISPTTAATTGATLTAKEINHQQKQDSSAVEAEARLQKAFLENLEDTSSSDGDTEKDS